jgi:uncharacterized HhH-GPD family protein
MEGTLAITGNSAADHLVNTDPLALLLAMMLDQQVPMEWAFLGPWNLRERLGGELDARAIAAMGEDAVEAVFRDKPALHRYPGSMGKRAYALCQFVVDEYDGEPARIWTEAKDGAALLARLNALPGYGTEKAKIMLAILGKRLGVAPDGWVEAAAPFSDSTPRSVADVSSPETLARVREWKQAQKAKKKSKAE